MKCYPFKLCISVVITIFASSYVSLILCNSGTFSLLRRRDPCYHFLFPLPQTLTTPNPLGFHGVTFSGRSL